MRLILRWQTPLLLLLGFVLGFLVSAYDGRMTAQSAYHEFSYKRGRFTYYIGYAWREH